MFFDRNPPTDSGGFYIIRTVPIFLFSFTLILVADALLLGVPIVPARARIHARHEHKRRGILCRIFALLILIILSSNGCSMTSSTFLENSGSSSKRKNLPHCNSLKVNHKANNNIHISNPHHSRNRSFIVIVA